MVKSNSIFLIGFNFSSLKDFIPTANFNKFIRDAILFYGAEDTVVSSETKNVHLVLLDDKMAKNIDIVFELYPWLFDGFMHRRTNEFRFFADKVNEWSSVREKPHFKDGIDLQKKFAELHRGCPNAKNFMKLLMPQNLSI